MSVAVRRILMIMFVMAVVAAVAYAFKPRPVEVELSEIRRGPMQVTVDEEGKTRVRQRYVVSAPLPGRTERIALEDGDPIVKGQTLLAVILPNDPEFLDSRTRAESEARLRRAEAAVHRTRALRDRAKANLDFTNAERQRMEASFKNKASSLHDYEASVTAHQMAENELRSEEFSLNMSEFELAQAQATLLGPAGSESRPTAADAFEIHAPITGKVFRVLQKSSAAVLAGAPLVEIGDPNDIEIVIDVLSTDAVKVTPGALVHIERWGGPAPLAGTVRLVEPSGFTKISALGVEEQRVNIIIDLKPGQTHTLGDGYRIEGRIVIWSQDDVVKAPTSALFHLGDDWAAFVVEADRAVLRRVRVGHQNGLEAEITGGLEPGETVIAHPSDRVHDGAQVRPR